MDPLKQTSDGWIPPRVSILGGKNKTLGRPVMSDPNLPESENCDS